MNITTFLEALPKIGSLITAVPEVAALVQEVVADFKNPQDQTLAQQGLDTLRRQNAAGHQSLQSLLAEASRR